MRLAKIAAATLIVILIAVSCPAESQVKVNFKVVEAQGSYLTVRKANLYYALLIERPVPQPDAFSSLKHLQVKLSDCAAPADGCRFTTKHFSGVFIGTAYARLQGHTHKYDPKRDAKKFHIPTRPPGLLLNYSPAQCQPVPGLAFIMLKSNIARLIMGKISHKFQNWPHKMP